MVKNKNTVVELVETTTEIEAPYELPEGWKWCRLPDYVSIVTGKKDANYGSPDGKYYFFTCAEIPLRCDGFSFSGESLLLPGNGANVGQVIYYDGDFEVYQRTYVLQKISNNISLKYLYYHILAFWEVYNRDKQYGSATNYIKMGNFLNYTFPLPPTLEEQQRIVNRIETLFAKLDQAKAKAQNVVDTFETRKASILHKAFTGELTKKWRAENGVGDDSWEEKTGETIFSYITSGSRGWASYYSDAGEMFIRMGNLNHGTIDLELSNIQYVNLPDSVEGTRSQLKEKDILISITADLGMIGLVRKLNTNTYINQHIALARPSSEVNAEFIAWELVSDIGFSQLQGNKKGSTKIGLGLSDIKNLRLLVPTLPEQTEIVLILDKVFEKENKAKEISEAVLEQIDLLKKSILARAFRGEL